MAIAKRYGECSEVLLYLSKKRQDNGTDKRARARVRACVRACMSACVHACVRACACARVRVRVCAFACVRACFGPAHRWTELPKTLSGAHYQSREEGGGCWGGLLKRGGKPGTSSTPQTFFGALNFIF